MKKILSGRQSRVSSSHLFVWLAWLAGASFFFIEYFARVVPSIMVPQLMGAFHATALGVGGVFACFYFPYVIMQIPAGRIVDRFSPHWLLFVMAMLCGFSCFLFAVSSHLYMAQLARVITGLTASFAFVGTLKMATMYFPHHRIGLLAGLTQGLGMLGAAFGEGPLSFLQVHIGWKYTIMFIGLLLFIVAFALFLVSVYARNHVPRQLNSGVTESLGGALSIVLKDKRGWVNALYAGLMFASIAAFGETWGVDFLNEGYGFPLTSSGLAVSAIFLGWAIGGPLIGALSDKLDARLMLMAMSSVLSFLLMVLILFLHLTMAWMMVVLFSFGVSNTGVSLAYATAGELHAPSVTGVSIAFCNMTSVLLGALLQPLIGYLMNLTWSGEVLNGIRVYHLASFRSALSPLLVCLLLAFIMVLILRRFNIAHLK